MIAICVRDKLKPVVLEAQLVYNHNFFKSMLITLTELYQVLVVAMGKQWQKLILFCSSN